MKTIAFGFRSFIGSPLINNTYRIVIRMIASGIAPIEIIVNLLGFIRIGVHPVRKLKDMFPILFTLTCYFDHDQPFLVE
ncbi:MAG TPA: hypothetical protein VMW36_02085 [Patescibacteria group bacterium]|nr:hypothetical protein [Patescibacteria group bacterium]